MNNKISNQFLKQLISEISKKTSEGRITDVSWGLIDEVKKKKLLKKEADEKKKDAPAEKTPTSVEDLPAEKGTEDTPKDIPTDKKSEPATDVSPEPDSEPVSVDDAEKDADKAKEDALKAQAELEKAKAEKDQAEKEIKKHAYVKLGSSSGTEYLLSKILDQAFKTNTIDALAGEMAEKLGIKTPEEMSQFTEDVAAYMTIPGMAQLLSSMKSVASAQSKKPEEPTA